MCGVCVLRVACVCVQGSRGWLQQAGIVDDEGEVPRKIEYRH